MNQLEYLPGIGGQAIQLDGPVAFVGTADKLRGREWNYDLGYRDLLNANRPARVVDVTLWTDADTANALRRVADADVMAGKPGTFVAQNEWRQRGYILEAEPHAIHYDDLEIGLKVALLDGAWWRLVEKEFLPEEPPTTEYASVTGEKVTVYETTETALYGLTVYGKCSQVDGTPTPNAPKQIYTVGPSNGDSIYLKVDNAQTAIDLDGNFLGSIQKVSAMDVLNVDSSGNVSIEKHVNRYVKPTVTWVDTVQGLRYIWFSIDSGNKGVATTSAHKNVLCSHGFPAESTMQHGSCYVGSGGTSFVLVVDPSRFPSSTFADVSAAQTWVNNNNFTFYYELDTAKTVSLDGITMPDVADASTVEVLASITPTITASWALTPEFYLDYPHNFDLDYSNIAAASSIESSVLTPSDIHLVIFGPATNPYIIVGGNKYQVNVTVPSGGYVTIDGREKTIVLTLADGTDQNAFSYGVRGGGQGGGTYVFEPIQAGTQEVTYSGTFGFNLGWYEEEGEPPWKSY